MGRPVVPFFDLTRQTGRIQLRLEEAMRRVLASGHFILGPEVARFEKEFARFCRSRFGVAVASGTDALELALRGMGIGPGDIVATVSFTFIATADAIRQVGADPLFVDIDPATYTMDPADLETRLRTLTADKRRRLKAVIPVHLYGHPCNMGAILKIAKRHRLAVIEDAAQAAGARWRGRPAGSFGDAGCFSFFPTKNLGAFGDGGMVVTDNPALDRKIRLLRVHGRKDRQRQVAAGRNSRLDELQAAILRVKLRRTSFWIRKRQFLAGEYTRRLSGLAGLQCPVTADGASHAYHLYVIRTKQRDRLRKALQAEKIPTEVYYSLPVHKQPLYRKKYGSVSLRNTDWAARETLALPLFPELRPEELRLVCRIISHALSSLTMLGLSWHRVGDK